MDLDNLDVYKPKGKPAVPMNIGKGKSFQISDSGNAAPNLESNTFFKLRQLDGDQQIYLGQSILALITLNRSPAYSEKQYKSFAIDLFASLIEELNITPEELRKELDNRKNNLKIR